MFIRIQKISSKKWHKIHNVWHPVKHHQVFKKHKNVTYKEEKNQLLKTNPNMEQMSALADKNIKTVTIVLFYEAQKFKLKVIF